MKFPFVALIKIVIVAIVIVMVASIVTNMAAPMTTESVRRVAAAVPKFSPVETPCGYFCLSEINDEEFAIINYGVSDISCTKDDDCCSKYCEKNCAPEICEGCYEVVLPEKQCSVNADCKGGFGFCGEGVCRKHKDSPECSEAGCGNYLPRPACEECSVSELSACPYSCNKNRGTCQRKEALDFSNLNYLPTFFSCNYVFLDFVQLALEFGKYEWNPDVGGFVYRNINTEDPWRVPLIGGGYVEYDDTASISFLGRYGNATKLLYDLFTGNIDSYPNITKYTMYEFCVINPTLSSYGYINCGPPLGMKPISERFDPRDFTIDPARWNATDSFSLACHGSGPYDACNYEAEKYGVVGLGEDKDPNCQPAWETFLKKKGSCNDLAVMEYTIFRTLGIPGEDSQEPINVSLELGVCDLPCPCKALAEKCGYSYEIESCNPLSRITVEPKELYGSYAPCDYLLQDAKPEVYDGAAILDVGAFSYRITTYDPKRPNAYCMYTMKKTFNNIDDEDIETVCFVNGQTYAASHPSKPCAGLWSNIDNSQLASDCAEFLDDPNVKTQFLADISSTGCLNVNV